MAITVGRPIARQALVAGAVVATLAVGFDELPEMLRRTANGVKAAVGESLGKADEVDEHAAFDARSADYAELQSHVPPGATMATAVFEPFRFDFKRNQVLVLDFLGGMGPPPGWPYKGGSEALGEYLLESGVQYLAWVDFDLPNEFYNRAHWVSHLRKTGHYLQGEAAFELDAEDAIEQLTSRRRVVYRGHDMTVVALAAPHD